MAVTQRTDAELAAWMNTPEFRARYRAWFGRFDATLADGKPLGEAELVVAVKDMAAALDIPDDMAAGMFKREIAEGALQ